MSDPTTPEPAPPARQEAHRLEQAGVPPLDVDGVQAATVGTVLFAVATVVMALVHDRLVAAGDGWWLGIGISGLGLGGISLIYTIGGRRRRRRREAAG